MTPGLRLRHGPLATVVVLALVGCREAPAADPAAAASPPPAGPGCDADSLRPATSAPAEGLWVHGESGVPGRVAAMIGPAQTVAGRSRVTRSIETVETRPGSAAIRHRADSTAVRLEMLPPWRALSVAGGLTLQTRGPGTHPAAAYPVGTSVLLASYEPCTVSRGEPRVRYLRRDTSGRLAMDVMLRRESGAP